MNKLKVYLDTSVISHLFQEDVPEKMTDTRQLWEMFRKEKYDVYLSTVTLEEIEDCPEPKRSQLLGSLEQINYTLVRILTAMLQKWPSRLLKWVYLQRKAMTIANTSEPQSSVNAIVSYHGILSIL